MRRHLISADATIVEALEALNRLSGETMTLFAIDRDGRLGGSVTDGDVRRALLAGHSLSTPVGVICNGGCLTIDHGSADTATIAEARRRHIYLLPIVDASRKISGLLDLRRQRGLVPADGVLMAGGIGERLRPLTETVPKPMLPVAGRPIIDYNIELLRSFGISRIFVTVNYLKEQIVSHLKGVTIVEEPRRLGTIGSLSLVERFDHDTVLVMNADLLTDINLEAMYLRHVETRAWLTVATVPYTVSVPFAILNHKGDCAMGLVEKPTYTYSANAGIYLLRREAVRLIPKGEHMDATDLIDSLIREGRRVTVFPIDGSWRDIGSPDDYRRAQDGE